LRRYILERDAYRCRLGFSVCTIQATEVDHIRRGDDHHETNLQAVCRNCHQVKSSHEGDAAKPKTKRPPERHPGLL
jgi:5-methylcytosine-specific restriction endonuclease McrA